MVINAIEYYDKNPRKEVAFFFIDAEKAFDTLNWDFMFLLRDKLDMGQYFISVVRAIYSYLN